MLRDLRQLLETSAYLPDEIERYMNPKKPAILKFDPELGYLHRNHSFRDGMESSSTAGTYEPRSGCRKMINYAEQPCRINTYGNSYTQCAQVSDGETWQEILAAHFREPIRNFGVGGYGVYQAYRRAMRMEAIKDFAAEYIILNVWDDDYLRNIEAARWVRVGWLCRDLPRGKKDGYPVHGFPWVHLRYDLKKGKWLELPGACKKVTDLRKLVGKENFYNAFKDDTVSHLYALREGGDAPIGDLEQLAEEFGLKVNLRDRKTRQADARKLQLTYGMRSTMFLVDKFRKWCKAHKRKLLVMLSYDVPTVQTYLKNGSRFDTEFVRFLNKNKYTYVDTLPKADQDFKLFKGSINEFCSRFYVSRAGAQVFGHYNPYGNFWFAYAIRKELVNWLNPKPLPYQDNLPTLW